jgi:hypothetical protein
MATLDIRGYRDEAVPNTFFRQEGETQGIAILLPGWGYTCQAPLLYYAMRVMQSLGADVLQVEYAYNRRPDFLALPEAEQTRWLFTDVTAAFHTALQQRAYQEVTLIGKSLGTLALSHLVSHPPSAAHARAIWLTPVLGTERFLENIRQWGGQSLFVIGTADPYYDENRLRELESATGGEALVIDGADHGLEIEGNVWRSLQELERIMRAIKAFLN